MVGKGLEEWIGQNVAFKHTDIKVLLVTFWRDFRRESVSHSCSHFRTTTWLLLAVFQYFSGARV